MARLKSQMMMEVHEPMDFDIVDLLKLFKLGCRLSLRGDGEVGSGRKKLRTGRGIWIVINCGALIP